MLYTSLSTDSISDFPLFLNKVLISCRKKVSIVDDLYKKNFYLNICNIENDHIHLFNFFDVIGRKICII